MWASKRVSVVLMTYAERGSIREVIDGFFDTGVVDEVLVVDNNAEAGTAAEVAKTRARTIHEPRQGYGHAMHRGLREAEGDLIVISEPDGTFLPSDIFKLLVYSGECDAVFGTRTTEELIWSGANMDGALRWGNWGVAKLIEVLFNTSHLSDVGCTYKLVTRELADRVLPELRVGTNHAGPELMLKSIMAGARFVEVPVNYRERVGVSAATGDRKVAVRIGLRMIAMIVRLRLAARDGRPRPRPLAPGSDS